MRVLSLDFDLGVGEDRFMFGSSVSLYDYDVVFWSPAASLNAYATYANSYRGRMSLREEGSARLVSDAARRRAEFLEFVEMGRCLVIITPGDTEVYVDTGDREYSGTGRNRASTTIVKLFDLMSAVPISVDRSPGSGTEMVPANATMASLFKQTAECWRYRSVFGEKKGLQPLLHITGTRKVVAGLLKVKGGGVIALLPDLRLPFADGEYEEAVDEDDVELPDLADDGQAAPATAREGGDDDDEPWPGDTILTWVESLMAEPDSSLPDWTADYRFATEVDRVHAQVELERKVTKLQLQVDQLNAEQAQDEKWKTLVTGTGVPLERRVREGLELLGFTLEEGVPGRTDLRGEYQGQVVVVEVKGVTKSAGERNAAQLEKWVSEELVEGRAAKGILVVNTWRDLPLRGRTEEDFPNQMHGYSIQRGHCLVTGLQLLALVRTVLQAPERKDEVAQLLLETVGVVENWSALEDIFAPQETAKAADASEDESVEIVPANPIGADDGPAE